MLRGMDAPAAQIGMDAPAAQIVIFLRGRLDWNSPV
jgi:hypothetical protein